MYAVAMALIRRYCNTAMKPHDNCSKAATVRSRPSVRNPSPPAQPIDAVDFDDLATGPAPQLPLESFQRRRERAAAAMDDDEILVVATHPQTSFSNDVEHVFRPHSDFWYLTGFAEPESVLTIEGGTGRTDLWLRTRKPEAEVWTGRRLGIERAGEALGVDAAHPMDELGADFKRRLASRGPGHVLACTDHHLEVDEHLRNALGETDPSDGGTVVHELRLRKDADELRMMREAARLGNEAMEAGLAHVRPGAREYEVEAAILHHYRRHGSTGPGYPAIVGSGANAGILHYIENRARIESGDLVLIDAGCEWGYYNSDITRTAPATGAWTEAQRDLYDLVHDAQKAAIATVRPGASIRAPHEAAVQVLAEGLLERGWITGALAEVLEKQSFRSYYMHGTSHFLGLDVHDVGGYKDDDGNQRLLEPGMILTVEPGLYVNSDFAPAPPGVPPLGIRIENDIIVTEDGHEDLQANLATDADAIAALVGRA